MTEQNNKNSLRQAENSVSIEGLLLEKEIHEGETANGAKYLSVELTIEIAKNEQHPVKMFSTATKKDGTPNGIYTSLRTVADDYNAVADDGIGRENADHITINQAEIRMNDYVGGDGQIRSFPQINAVFANRVEGREPNPHAKFDVEVVVANVIEEYDKNEEETGRAKLKGYLPLYGGKIAPLEFIVNENGSGYVLDNYENGNTVQVWGEMINKREEIVQEVEGAFGGSNIKKKYSTVREYVITGGSEVYEEDNPNSYDVELLKTALNEREVFLEELKSKKQEKKGGKKTGFDTGASAKKTKREVKDDGLPF